MFTHKLESACGL